MNTAKPILLFCVLLFTAFAGCAGEDQTLNAAFVATNVDAEKTMFKFDASASTGKDLKFSWDFGDRTEPKSGEVVDHSYQYPNGVYDVTLTVTDAAGASKKVTQPVTTGNGQNAEPLLYLSVDKRLTLPEDEVFFDGSQSFDPDGDPIFFEWDFNAELDEQTLMDMENLGFQSYGRYPEGKPAPSGGSNSSSSENEERGLTPSGHVLADEIKNARARLNERMNWTTLHGGEPGAAEPRNTELDGKIEDTSPIQFYAFPSPAVYYVHVRVEDIKGAGQEGFIKISIDETVPPASNSTPMSGQLKPGPLSPLQGVVPSRDVESYSVWTFRYELPATSNLTLTYSRQGDQGDELVAVYVCSKSSLTECSAGTPKAKLAPGASGRSLQWTVNAGESLPFPYYVIVANEGNAVIDFEFPVQTTFDTNPWAKDEAGFTSAHH